MKYDVELALDNANTSHAQVVDLVGTGKRVLDVGCSTGALARALKARSNRVWGIEIDPQAARIAEPDLEQIVVGDVESTDLFSRFEPGSFDAIIFADVLEHLRDPVAVLQRASALLSAGGSFVISLPNVAHGSVRLALLEGRFEYRPLGLLDDTHLRFFTRRSVEDLLQAADLVAVDMRRTTADIFETEIPLSPQQFDRQVVEGVRAQPDSDTYQFVFRAVPVTDRQGGDLTSELVARNEELSSLRAELTQIRGIAERFAPPHSVGLLVDPRAERRCPWTSLRTSVTSLELRRRIDHLALVHLSRGSSHDPATWRGEPIEGLRSLDAAASELVASVYDAVVVTAEQGMPELGAFAADVVDRGCPVIPFGVSRRHVEPLGGNLREGAVRAGRGRRYESLPGVIAVPDPLVLADRLVGGHDLSGRLDYLRETGRLAVRRPYVLVSVENDDPDLLPALSRTVAEIASTTECRIVVLPGPRRENSVESLVDALQGAAGLDDPHELDLLALVQEARLVVTNAAPVAALAMSMRRPLVAYGADESLIELAEWTADPDIVAATPAEMLGRIGLADARAADDGLVRRLQAPVELAYDDVAMALRGASGRGLTVSIVELLELQRTRIASLQQANAALQGRLVSERNQLANRARGIAGGLGDREPPTPRDLAELDYRVKAAEAKAAEEWQGRQDDHARMLEAMQIAHQLKLELDAVMATRAMRALSPARKLYGRLRGR